MRPASAKSGFFFSSRGHRGINEPRFDRQDSHVALEQTAAETLKEDLNSSLGCTIDIVRPPAPAAGHGTDHRKAPVPLGFQPICEQRKQSNGPSEIDVQRFHCLVYLLLATLLIRKSPMRNQCHVDRPKGSEGRFDHGALSGKIGNIQDSCLDPSRSPDPKVVCHSGQAVGIPTGQEEMGSVFGEFLCRFTRDGRRRAHDEHPGGRVTPR